MFSKSLCLLVAIIPSTYRSFFDVSEAVLHLSSASKVKSGGLIK